MVGLTLVINHPEDYTAYIGISQVVNFSRGMEVSQDWVKRIAKEKNDTAALHLLERLNRGDTTFCKGVMNCFIRQYGLVSKYGGAVYNPDSEKEVEKAMTMYEDYMKYDWNQAFEFSSARLEKDLSSVDFSGVHSVDIPAYLILGRHDWNVPSILGQEFLEKLKAPCKEIVWFENSGHGPPEEEPEKFNRVIDSILNK